MIIMPYQSKYNPGLFGLLLHGRMVIRQTDYSSVKCHPKKRFKTS